MRFKHIKPHRTFSNYILTEIARLVRLDHTSSGWFNWSAPSLTAFVQVLENAICTRFQHIEPHQTFSNYTLTEIVRFKKDSKVYRLLSPVFGVVWMFSNYSSSGTTRCAGSTNLQFREIQAHRTSSNRLFLHHHRDNKVFRLPLHKFSVIRGPNLSLTISNLLSLHLCRG